VYNLGIHVPTSMFGWYGHRVAGKVANSIYLPIRHLEALSQHRSLSRRLSRKFQISHNTNACRLVTSLAAIAISYRITVTSSPRFHFFVGVCLGN